MDVVEVGMQDYTGMPLGSMSIFQDFLDCSEGNQAPDQPHREGGLLSFA